MPTRQHAPARAGIGLRTQHMAEVIATRPATGFLEIHAENYMAPGPALDGLLTVRRDYPVSVHGVGLSLGSASGIDRAHLERLRRLVSYCDPVLVSEHLSWSAIDGISLNDLLPLPYTEETLDIVAGNIEAVQEDIGRMILIENPSRYLRFRHSTVPEPEFLAELVRRTGCGLLCDVNNIYVSSINLGGDPHAYLAALPREAVGEIHLAGHARGERNGRPLLIDDHGSPVCDNVWSLYRHAVARFGAVPSLIEWDTDIPDLPVLVAEARHADGIAEEMLAHALAS